MLVVQAERGFRYSATQAEVAELNPLPRKAVSPVILRQVRRLPISEKDLPLKIFPLDLSRREIFCGSSSSIRFKQCNIDYKYAQNRHGPLIF